MSEGGTPEAAEAEVVQRRGPSIVWVIPAVALVIGAIIWYQSAANLGPVVTIYFGDGGGIEAGKTKVRFRGLEVAEVLEVGIRDIDTVQVTAQFGPNAKPYITSQTKFWLVKPRIGAGGISGLDTLVSGSYIGIQLPPIDENGNPLGDPTLEFVALEKPPIAARYPNGLRIGLEADDLRGLNEGANITFRDIPVGEVERYELKPDGQGVRLWALVSEEYRDLVRPSTEFWNSSGVELEVRPSSVKVEAESLASMLSGGIDFETPPEAYIERPVGDGAIFTLHRNRQAAREALEAGVGLRLWVEAYEVGGLGDGDPIFYRDVKIGRVEEPVLAEDARSVRFPVHIDERYATLVRKNSRFWSRTGIHFEAGWQGVETKVGTLGTLLAGGVGLATPDRPGELAEEDDVYVLHSKPDDAWLTWSPAIEIRQLDEDEEQIPRVIRTHARRYSGLRLVLSAPKQGSLTAGAPVHYRGRVVGEVGATRFAPDARKVDADVWIERRYATLVRANTRFWNASGIEVKAGITSGVKIRTESLQSIVTGGVAFATPDSPGAEVEAGTRFTLHEKPSDSWLRWAPALPLR